MCKLFITEEGTIVAPAIIRIPATNFVAPLLKEHELITSIEPREENIPFIVDTGAQITCLSGLDAERLQIETRYLEPATDVIGVGGKCSAFRLDDIEIGLIDDITDERVSFHIEKVRSICVISSLKMNSLLGNDVLARFNVSTDRQNNVAELKRIAAAPGEFRIVSRPIPRDMIQQRTSKSNKR